MSGLSVGQRVTYYPKPVNQHDNRHWPAVIEDTSGKTLKVRVFRDDAPPPDGRVVRCSRKRIVVAQTELLGEPIT